DGIINKTKSWEDALRDVTRALLKAMLQSLILGQGPLAGIMGPASATPGGAGGLLGAAFTQRQQGGPVRGGSPYIVGEHGPELFVPKQSGRIVPGGISKPGMGGGGY